jgi:uncharacterized protein YciI
MKYVIYAKYTSDKEKILAHRPAHRDYVGKLVREGKLVLAGPFVDDSGGLFIYDVESPEAASMMVSEDPFSINQDQEIPRLCRGTLEV